MADMEHAENSETRETTDATNAADATAATAATDARTDTPAATIGSAQATGVTDVTDVTDPTDANDARDEAEAPSPRVIPQARYERYQRYDPTGARDAYDEMADELERQAREAMGVIRETMGDLGDRVRQTLEYTSSLWNDAAEPPEANESDVHELADIKARALARRWVERDFLVEPNLPVGMGVTDFQESAVWRVELRERGETRTLAESSEPYRGARPSAPGPVLPVWDYDFPITPDLEAGERRERLANTESLGACVSCNGAGNRVCISCEGKGFTQCPTCHGKGRNVCRRCRGRGRIADPAAERRARADKGYVQVQAERLGVNAAEWLADLSERLRQDYGVPLPPSGQWAPQAPASGETIPCPDCMDGYTPCTCNNGKLVCAVCHGSARSECPACAGTGQVIRRREVLRRFDTRIGARNLPLDDGAAEWVTEPMLRKNVGEIIWQGAADAMGEQAPRGTPGAVWAAARELVRASQRDARSVAQPGAPQESANTTAGSAGAGERHVIARQVVLSRTPVTRVDYLFADRPYTFVAVGTTGAERFWSDSFPPRWSRLGRFVQALARDVSGDRAPRQIEGEGHRSLRDLRDLRAQRSSSTPGGAPTTTDDTDTLPRLRIVEDRPAENDEHDANDAQA